MAEQAFGFQTWPHLFVPELQKFMAAGITRLSADRVFQSVYDDDIHLKFPPADKFITLFLPEFAVDQADVFGGGAFNTAFNSTLTTTVFVRLEADIEGRSAQFLDEEANGLWKFLQQVVTQLQMWNGPVDPDTEVSHFRRPMRLRPGFRVSRKSGKGGSRWGVSHISWEVSFVANLRSPYPL